MQAPTQMPRISSSNNDKKLTPQEQQERTRLITKSNNVRALINLKGLMDKRKQQRSLATYYLINFKYQSALIVGRQLMYTSLKVWKQFNDDFKTDFQQQFFFRTNKVKEHVQYLLDAVILCKIFIAGKKRQDAVDILDKLEVPQAPLIKKQPVTNEQKLCYNQAHEVYSKTCGVLLNLIEVTKIQRLHEYTQRMFSKYLKFVKTYYGPIQYGTALFSHAYYLYESKIYDQAEKQFLKCIQIRKKNVYNGGLIDAMVNSAICLKELCQYDLAISRIKAAIQITRDIMENSDEIDNYYLFLAKIYFQMGDFKLAYHNFLITYKLRQNLSKGDPKKVETELNFIFFYRTLKDIARAPSQHLNILQKNDIELKRVQAQETIQILQDSILQREDFGKYKQFKTSKMAHLTLAVLPQLFEHLTSSQIKQLTVLKDRLNQLTFMRGISELQKCSFYEQKKTRDLLLQANPQIKNVKLKGS